jgi:predicted O-methyltransferase YrrM
MGQGVGVQVYFLTLPHPDKMSNHPATAIRYLRFRLRARSEYDLHSPFVFGFWSQVLTDNAFYEEYGIIEKLRAKLLKDRSLIHVTDLGAGAGDGVSRQKIALVRKIIKNSSVTPSWGRLLFRMARYFRPAVMVELGTSLGMSTAYLAIGNPLGKVTSIEGCPETAAIAKRNFGILGLDNIQQETAPFEEILPGLLEKLGKVDLFFIDGNHRKEPSLQYFHQCLQHIRDDSVVILDDIHWSVEMEEAWKAIQEHPSVTLTIDLFRMGLVFFKEGLSREDFVLHF